MAPFDLVVDEGEGVLLLPLLLEGVVELEVEFEPDPHSACCSARADAWSAAVQFALRHAAAAAWKAVLEHTQVMSV